MKDPHNEVRPSIRRHKRQFLWQILVPFLVMLALIMTIAVLIVSAGSSNTRLGADISVIWLIAPFLFLALGAIAILAGLIYLIARLARIIPSYSVRLQSLLFMVDAGSRRITDGIAKPFFWFHQAGAVLRSFFKRS